MTARRPKFVVDSMLGKLARWLRMLGCDVKYAANLDDTKLLEISKEEGRILLTRDVGLFQKAAGQHAETLLVEGKSGAERLAAISERFSLELELDPWVSRCPNCNTPINRAVKSEIADKIPPNTKIFYEEFWVCPKCDKIYWQGAHWPRITETLSQAKKIMSCSGKETARSLEEAT